MKLILGKKETKIKLILGKPVLNKIRWLTQKDSSVSLPVAYCTQYMHSSWLKKCFTSGED